MLFDQIEKMAPLYWHINWAVQGKFIRVSNLISHWCQYSLFCSMKIEFILIKTSNIFQTNKSLLISVLMKKIFSTRKNLLSFLSKKVMWCIDTSWGFQCQKQEKKSSNGAKIFHRISFFKCFYLNKMIRIIFDLWLRRNLLYSREKIVI